MDGWMIGWMYVDVCGGRCVDMLFCCSSLFFSILRYSCSYA